MGRHSTYFLFHLENGFWCAHWVKAWNKEPQSVWIVFKNYFLNFWGKKKLFHFKMFQESFYMFKTLKKNMWISGFFYFKSPFSLSDVHQIISIFFCELWYIHKKGSMCSKYSKNKNMYTLLDFDTQTYLSIIMVLNL